MSEVTAVLWATTVVLWAVLAIVSLALLMVTDAGVKCAVLFPLFFCLGLIQIEFKMTGAAVYVLIGIVQVIWLSLILLRYLDVCGKRWGDDEEDFEDENSNEEDEE